MGCKDYWSFTTSLKIKQQVSEGNMTISRSRGISMLIYPSRKLYQSEERNRKERFNVIKYNIWSLTSLKGIFPACLCEIYIIIMKCPSLWLMGHLWKEGLYIAVAPQGIQTSLSCLRHATSLESCELGPQQPLSHTCCLSWTEGF